MIEPADIQVTQHPGFNSCWGSTRKWKRKFSGPFVAVTYTKPDDKNLSTRREYFANSFEEAEKIALSPQE